MRWIALVGLFALAGCWTGGPFYQASDAVPAIAEGDYRASGPGGPQTDGPVRVARLPNGVTEIVPLDDAGAPEPDAAMRMGFAPLAGSDDMFAGWLERLDGRDLTGDNAAYLLMTRLPDGGYRLAVPGCTDALRTLAVEAGAEAVDDGGLLVCRFRDRASLEAALRRFAPLESRALVLTPLRPRS